MQDAHAGSTTTCFSGMGRAVPHWLAGSPLRAYHASRARVQSMGHGSTLCPINTCQWGMGLLPCPIDTCQWGMGQQARARLTRVIWNTSQSGTLHRKSTKKRSSSVPPRYRKVSVSSELYRSAAKVGGTHVYELSRPTPSRPPPADWAGSVAIATPPIDPLGVPKVSSPTAT